MTDLAAPADPSAPLADKERGRAVPLERTPHGTPPSIRVLGHPVGRDAWAAFKSGRLDLAARPRMPDTAPDAAARFPDKLAELSCKLRAVSPHLRDDGLLTLLNHVADALDSGGHKPEIRRKLMMIAQWTVKIAGLPMDEGIDPASEAVGDFDRWLSGFSPDATPRADGAGWRGGVAVPGGDAAPAARRTPNVIDPTRLRALAGIAFLRPEC